MSDYRVHAIERPERTGDSYKTYLGAPEWLKGLGLSQGEGADKVDGSAAAYSMVPLIFRAVKLRCDAISQVPVHVFKGETEVAWPFAAPRSELIWRTEAALLLEGLSVWLKLPNYKRVTDLQWLNPYTVEVKYDKDRGTLFSQQMGTANTGPWTLEQVVYFREFNPVDDIGRGTSAAVVALEDARLLRYLTRFAARYFEHGAMPVTLLGFEYAPNEAERARVENWFKKMASGISNAWKVLALRGKITPSILTPPPKELAMGELNNQARHNVAMAFGIPQTMLEDAANYATAGEHRMSFWQETVKPRGPLYEDILNGQLFGPMGLRVRFNFEELGIFQVDEAERSDALLNLTQAGFDTLTAAEQLGYQLTEEQRGRIEELEAVGKITTNGTNNTNDINGTNKSDREAAIGKKINTKGAEEEGAGEEGEAARAVANREKLVREELRAWERKALKKVKEGKRALVSFVCEQIPKSLAGAIEGALEMAETAEDVKRIFADARWEGYP